MAAIAAYCLTRLNLPELVASLQATKPLLVPQFIDRVHLLGPQCVWAPQGKAKSITNTTTAPWEAP